MSSSYLRTRTARYFINKYNRASLLEAIEDAARRERETLLPGMNNYCKITVDIESIARRRGIIRGEHLPDDDPSRFSLAHEIGHTLFLHRAKHQIAVFSKEEIAAEEYICNRFAEALLMPQGVIADFVSKIPYGSPWSIMTAIENASRKLQVSLPALITRIGHIKSSPLFPFIALCLRYFANKYTGEDPCLRIAICSPIGDLRNTRTWSNRSAAGLNLSSADYLFTKWQSELPDEGEPLGGRYTIDNDKKVPASEDSLKWIAENIQLSVCRSGKWYKEITPISIMNCLYARRGWTEDKAYIISIVKLKESY
ncbi:MAG: ImmA/IrrE family metallo-endopeptidase [Nitrospirae bacterium]|nr:ImmA/IrrE family metallo-endopeptidase [Nitrospirota bacterium]